MKIAEHNNLDDADVVMKGMEIDIPTQDQLDGIELKEFKVESLDDLKNLDKLPYGSELTPEELKHQIKDVLKSEFPGQEMRIHETMAYVNDTLSSSPEGKPLHSMGKLDVDKLTEIMHGDNKIEIVDEQESPYNYKEVVNNELKNKAVDYDVKTPDQMTSDEQELAYTDNSYESEEDKLARELSQEVDKTPEVTNKDGRPSPIQPKFR